MAEIPASAALAMDWQFAFARSEMLRDFQAGLLISIGHELRTPLSSQIGSLQMVLCDLCDSWQEEREYLQIAKHSVEDLLQVLEEYSQLVRHPLPVQPLVPAALDLHPVLTTVHRMTALQAQDRGIRYQWPDLEQAEIPLAVYADQMGLSQVLLGLCWWGIQRLYYGTFQVGEPSASASPDWINLPLQLSGRAIPPFDPRDHPHGQVCERLLREMGGQLHQLNCQENQVQLMIQLPCPAELPVDPLADPVAARPYPPRTCTE